MIALKYVTVASGLAIASGLTRVPMLKRDDAEFAQSRRAAKVAREQLGATDAAGSISVSNFENAQYYGACFFLSSCASPSVSRQRRPPRDRRNKENKFHPRYAVLSRPPRAQARSPSARPRRRSR